MFEAAQLRCNHLFQPLGVEAGPLLSWVADTDENGKWQTAARVQVSACRDNWTQGLWWDSGRQEITVPRMVFHDPAPVSNAERWWRVKIWAGTAASA